MMKLNAFLKEELSKDQRSLLDAIIKRIEKQPDLLEPLNYMVNDPDLLRHVVTKHSTDESGKKPRVLIEEWVEKKMLGDNKQEHRDSFIKAMENACSAYHCYPQVIKLIKAQSNPNPKEPRPFYGINLNFSLKKIIESFRDIKRYFKGNFGIPEGFFDDIFDATAADQPAIGKGEFLLRLISKFPEVKVGGDVIIDGIGVEVKNLTGKEASLGNSKLGNANLIFDFLKYFNSEVVGVTMSGNSSGEKIEAVKAALEKLQQKSIRALVNDFNSCIGSFGSVKNNYTKVIKAAMTELKKIDLTKDWQPSFIKIFTALYTIMYCNEEGAQYLCYIDKENFNFVLAENNPKTFNDILNDSNFPFHQIRYSGSKNYVQIKCNR